MRNDRQVHIAGGFKFGKKPEPEHKDSKYIEWFIEAMAVIIIVYEFRDLIVSGLRLLP
jgi:hypothetical protein